MRRARSKQEFLHVQSEDWKAVHASVATSQTLPYACTVQDLEIISRTRIGSGFVTFSASDKIICYFAKQATNHKSRSFQPQTPVFRQRLQHYLWYAARAYALL